MSNKKPGFTGKTLEDALREEADDIERRALAHAPEHRLSREEKDAMLKNILDRVKEKESAEEDTSSGSEDKKEEKNLDETVEALIEKRQAARKAKDFQTADAIRDQLKEMGILLEDTPQGVKWKRA